MLIIESVMAIQKFPTNFLHRRILPAFSFSKAFHISIGWKQIETDMKMK